MIRHRTRLSISLRVATCIQFKQGVQLQTRSPTWVVSTLKCLRFRKLNWNFISLRAITCKSAPAPLYPCFRIQKPRIRNLAWSNHSLPTRMWDLSGRPMKIGLPSFSTSFNRPKKKPSYLKINGPRSRYLLSMMGTVEISAPSI